MGNNISNDPTNYDRNAVVVFLVKCKNGGLRIAVLKEKAWDRKTQRFYFRAGFAGGGYERKDGTNSRGLPRLFYTAAREANEEIRVPPSLWLGGEGITREVAKFSFCRPHSRNGVRYYVQVVNPLYNRLFYKGGRLPSGVFYKGVENFTPTREVENVRMVRTEEFLDGVYQTGICKFDKDAVPYRECLGDVFSHVGRKRIEDFLKKIR